MRAEGGNQRGKNWGWGRGEDPSLAQKFNVPICGTSGESPDSGAAKRILYPCQENSSVFRNNFLS